MATILISLCLTTLLAGFLFFKQLLKRTTTKLNLPPSPWKLPVIGNLHQLSLHPHRSFHSLSRRYGPLMVLYFGRVPILVISSAEVAQEVLKTHDIKFANRPKTKAVDIILNGGREVVFGPYGEYWRQMKSMFIVHLLSTKMVKSFDKLREEEINIMMKKLEKASSSSSSVNLSEVLTILTNDVICKVILGRKYNGGDDEGGVDIKNLIKTFSEIFGEFPIGEYIPCLKWIDWIRGLDYKLENIKNKFDGFVEIVIQEHIEKRDDNETSDFVDLLLKIQREKIARLEFDRSDIKLIIWDLFVGGTATTSTLLEWTMTELMRHPACMKKLRDEIKSVSTHNLYVKEEEVVRMFYLQAVIKEVLRLHPSGPLIPRLLSEDVKLKGYDIAAGTQVMINVWAIQRDTTTWGPDAEEFNPERNLDSALDFRGQNFNFIPFGSGRRLCPGIGFALAFVEVTLANLVKRFEWRVKAGPAIDNDKPDLAEATGVDVCRKFPLIVFPM